MKYYIYKIVNKTNEKCYVGMTKRDIQTRFEEHKRCAMKKHDLNNDYMMPLYYAMRKYGTDVFEIKLISVQEFDSHIDAEIMEGHFIKENASLLSQNGYNLNMMGCDHKRIYEIEIKEKIIENNTGKRNPFFGKKHTDETKEKISKKAKKRFSDPTKNPRYGYKYTEEDKKRHREIKKKFGKPFYADGIIYETLSEAAIKYNLTKQAIKNRIISNSYKNWYYKK